ncbi:Threonine aldolase [Chytriomyces hyalinus]|nr:Threonine aldolase [Chytriomyces hyalinus]
MTSGSAPVAAGATSMYAGSGKNMTATAVIADLRSDTVTTPTPEMRRVMAEAIVGDDVYQEDATIQELESLGATLSGHEAALFCATGTMTNQIGIRTLLVAPPYSILADARSHIFNYEASGVAHHSQALIIPVPPAPGFSHLTVEEIEKRMIIDDDIHHAPTRVICLENTLGGEIFPLSELEKISEMAKKHGIKMHLDGARLWNASAATGVDMKTYCQLFDTVSLCLSKGLGAPIGSLLVGSHATIKRARHFRKMFGGGWRQGGILAAAGIHVIKHHFPRLNEDHATAKLLAEKLTSYGFKVTRKVETNMIWFDSSSVGVTGDELQAALASKGVRVFGGSGREQRWVVHHQVTGECVEAVGEALANLFEQRNLNDETSKEETQSSENTDMEFRKPQRTLGSPRVPAFGAQASRIFCEILLHDWRFAHRHMKFFLTTYAEDEDQFYYEILDEQPNDLPLPYAASMLRSCFTDYSYGNDILLDSSLYFSVSKHAGEKIVAFLEDFLDTDARAHMLEWMVGWAGISKQTVMDILRNDKDVPVPRRFMYTAAKNGWTDVGQLLLNRGFKVMPKAGGVLAPVGVLADDSILTHAVRHGQNEMVALLVQDKQVNMSNHINSLYCLSKSLDIAETLFLAPRVKNGEFLLSIARGDVDAVTKHLDSSANFNHANPNKSCLSVAIHYDQPDVLTVLMQDKRLLLTDSHHQNLLRDSAVGQSWKVFRNLIGHPRSNPFQMKWKLFKLLCSGETYAEDRLEAFKAFVSREDVKKCMDCARWGEPLQLACKIGAMNLFKYVLTEAGDTVDINRSAVVGAAIERASARQSGVQMLKILASRKSFRPLDTEMTGQLVSTLRAPTSPLAEYVLSKDQRFFSPAYLQRAFNDACKSKVKRAVETLSQLPGIQVSPSQSEVIESLKK